MRGEALWDAEEVCEKVNDSEGDLSTRPAALVEMTIQTIRINHCVQLSFRPERNAVKRSGEISSAVTLLLVDFYGDV